MAMSINDLAQIGAMSSYLNGDKEPLVKLLSGNDNLLPETRDFLAKIVEGKVSVKAHRPKKLAARDDFIYTVRVPKKQYIAQDVDMIRSAAYLDLSGNAVKLLVLMQCHWRMYEPIAYSISEAQKRVGCCRGNAHKAFKELESHGFIRLSPPIIMIPTESYNPKLYLEMMGKVEAYRSQGIEVKTITIRRA